MANKDGHRRFGSIRKLPSGRYQVRYKGPDGRDRAAPNTFAKKTEAQQYLSLVEAQMVRREWIDPDRGAILLQDYAERWIAQRPRLRPRTVQLYTWVLGKHITPYLGQMPLNRIDTPTVREWRAVLLKRGVSESMTAKAYRLLRAVFMTAVKEDELIRTNPCRIPGADQEHAPERPVLTLAEVFQLADKMPGRFRALILVTTFASLRWGEVSALQRQDIDVDAGQVHVRRQYVEVRGTGMVLGPPKSRAGVRSVALPTAVMPEVQAHLAGYVGDSADSLVFAGQEGRAIWRGTFNKLVRWKDAVAAIGVPALHFHDLRHTGNVLAARSGATLKDLMARMGQDSPRAGLIYQHRVQGADRAIADSMSDAIEQAQSEVQDPDDGAAGVPARRS